MQDPSLGDRQLGHQEGPLCPANQHQLPVSNLTPRDRPRCVIDRNLNDNNYNVILFQRIATEYQNTKT